MNICTYSVGEEEEEASCSLPGFYCPLCGLLLRPTHDAWTQMGTIKLAANIQASSIFCHPSAKSLQDEQTDIDVGRRVTSSALDCHTWALW